MADGRPTTTKPRAFRVTSFDVAAEAGVSQSTVSRALAGDPVVSETTRSRVFEAARRLNYAVDENAARLRSGRTATLAVQEAVQMHGGMGMTDAFDMGFFMKRARVLQELFGDSNFHLNQLAQSRGY